MFFSPGTPNLKEEFPIESLPLEILGSDNKDALSILYQKKEHASSASGPRFPLRNVGVDAQKFAFFKKIIPILDGFDNIFRYSKAQDIQGDEVLSTWLGTLETLYRRLIAAMEKEGLVGIEAVGKTLDLSYQEVIETRDVAGVPHNSVIEEVARGYKYGSRVLRDAKVIVANNPDNVGVGVPSPVDGLEFDGAETLLDEPDIDLPEEKN